MSLQLVTGDLLELGYQMHFSKIMHGCNCHHAFGSGIARQIKLRWPEAYEADLATPYGDHSKLGTHSKATVDNHCGRLVICNVYTQFGVSNKKDVFEYDAFERYLKTEALKIKEKAPTYDAKGIGLPYIGNGLAGGDWSRIQPLLVEFAYNVGHYTAVTLVKYDHQT
jgi:O-acetyl-ADP-ribose deacetylase (regulator of RNase III)